MRHHFALNAVANLCYSAYPLELNRAQSDLYLYLCDLLSGFLLQHSYQSHYFVTAKNLAPRIASLLYAREKHLRLGTYMYRTWLLANPLLSRPAVLPDLLEAQQ